MESYTGVFYGSNDSLSNSDVRGDKHMRRGTSCFFMIFIFIVSGCSFIKMPDTSNSICMNVESNATSEVNDNHRYYVVLIEGSEEYIPYREQSIQVLSNVLQKVLEPGDKMAAIWMEVSNLGNDGALFFTDEVGNIPLPALTPESRPVFLPTLTPLAQKLPPAGEQLHKKDAQDVEAQNTAIAEDYNCKYVYPVREANNETIAGWGQAQNDEILRVTGQFTQSVQASNPDVMSVFEALELASNIFGDVCATNYKDCQLIIVASMVDWRVNLDSPEITTEIQNMGINFSEVSVSVLWPDCKFFVDQFRNKCGSRRTTWQKYFMNFNASEDGSNLIFLNQDNATDKLLNFIGEEK